MSSKNDTIRSGIHAFLLTFHSNHEPISHRFRYIRRFQWKSQNFPTPCIVRPSGIWYRRKRLKSRMMGLPEGLESFKIGLAL